MTAPQKPSSSKGIASQLAAKSVASLTHHLRLWHEVLRDHSILDRARSRVLAGVVGFSVAFILIGFRLMDVMCLRSPSAYSTKAPMQQEGHVLERADIVDRHGETLATHLVTASVYANPKVIINPVDAAEKLCALIPELDFDTTLKRLSSKRGFVWIMRHISPKLQQSIYHLGIPGLYLQKDQRRVYPFGSMASHVLGYCGLDNIGLSGVERYFNHKLCQHGEPLMLSIDIRAQHVVHELLSLAVEEFQCKGANAMLLDMKTGQLLAMVSLPDFDPNQPNQNDPNAIFNRNTSGVYEPGSVVKIFNTSIALETGRISATSQYDASRPLKVGRFTITDFRGKNRILTVQEAFLYSSNIASAKMALDFGLEWQQKYFRRLGLFSKPKLEIPEVGAPIYNRKPTEATLISTSFGYAISISPLQTFRAAAALINHGQFRDITLLKQVMPMQGDTIVSPKTSKALRHMMALTATEGTARKAQVKGYPILGKTGSSYLMRNGKYHKPDKTTSFIGAFPADDPKYLLLVMLDSPRSVNNPKGFFIQNTHGYSTGGWNACPVGGKMIERLAPLLGVPPSPS